MKTVLVVYASRMGSTAEIASGVGDQLTRRGFDVEVQSATDARDARLYDSVIVGSPVYLGRWDREALRYLHAQAPDLAERPTWLFQSGPCGENADEQVMPPKKVSMYAHRINTPRPVTFGGRLDPATATGFIARKMAAGPLAGDFRDFTRIRAFAAGIADQLTAPKPIVAER